MAKGSKKKTPSRKWTAILLVVLCLAGFLAWREWSLNDAQRDFIMLLDQQTGNYNEDRAVLSSTTRREAERMAEEFGGTLRITKDGRFAVINLPEGMTLSDIAKNDDYRKYHDRILLDYNNFTTADEDTVDDTEIRSGYLVEDPMYAQQTYIDYLNIGGAWDLTRGADSNGEKVTVAIIDTGIDTDHPEFYDAAGNSIFSTKSYDATNDKVVDQYNISVIEDTNGHGTAVAGIIAAQMNNEGIAGIAPDVELLVIKCETDEAGAFKSSADIVFAIYYAIEMDVDVINMSLGGGGGVDMAKALQLAVDSDIICVAAAGNESSDDPHYPAAFDTVIGVGALVEGGWEIADYSNYGVNSDIMAPGTALTTAIGGEYTYRSGTSISAPMVSAAVAMYLAQNKYATYHEVKADLLAAGKDLGNPGEDKYYGFGALDINAFICEEKGVITYDYCTEEIGSATQVFVRRHTIQTVPEPEREKVVFDDWYYDKAYTRVFDYDAWYSTEFVEDVTLYAKWVNEDDEGASVYNYRTLADGTIEIVKYKGKRRYLTIPNEIDGKTVSSLGEHAFAGNTRLREVTFPEGLVYIKESAFSNVSKMRAITFTGDRLLQIDKEAFTGCVSLRELTLPDSVTTIGASAFRYCGSMTSVKITANSSLTSVGGFAFSKTNITSFYIPKNVTAEGFDGSVLFGCAGMRTISVHSENTAFTVSDSTLYNAAKTTIVYYPAALTGSYAVADGVDTIGGYAFAGSVISDVDLNSTVTIGQKAFVSTRNLSSVVLPNTVISLGEHAFQSSAISQVTLSENLSVISAHAFADSKLSSVHIPDKVQTICESAFANCTYLQTLTFADGSVLESILGGPSSGAFANCSILRNFVLPNSLKIIGEKAFYNCCSITALSIPANVSSVGSSAFQYCSLLQQVDFADGCILTSIPSYCFANCTVLNTVNFSDGIVKLSSYAFSNDHQLQNLNFGENSSLTTVGDYCFYTCSALQTMQLPDSVTTIGQFAYAFSGLKRVDISANVSSIGYCAFGACYALTEISVDDSNTAYAAVDNVLFNKDISVVYCVPASRTGNYTLPETVKITAPYSFYFDKFLTAVILPQGLEDIQMNSFYSCSSLAGIEIPANVANIGRKAFENCWAMASVTFGSGSRLERLGIYTFVRCGFSEITIPASVEEIAQYVFYNCHNLKRITFEENSGLTYIAAYLFKGTQVESVIFEDGSTLESLQAHAFDGASRLKRVDFGDAQITNIDNYAFYNCEMLTEILVPDTVTYIGRYAFYGCSKLDRIDLPESVDYIGESAFVGTDNIRLFFAADNLPANVQDKWDKGISGYFLGAINYVVTDEWEYAVRRDGTIALSAYKGSAAELTIDTLDGYTVSRIGARCFYNNDNLESLTLSENITEIGNYSFFDCDRLSAITVPASVEKIGKYAFADSAVNVTLAENSGLKIIDDYAFSGNVTASLVLPDTVTEIGDGAFLNSGLTDLTITQTSTLEYIGQQAFVGCGISEIFLPASLKTVSVEAFKNVTSLTDLKIAAGDTALKLSNSAFEGSGITEITIPARVWYIGEYTLGSCQNLQNIFVDSANTSYTALDGVLCDINGATLIQYPCGRSGGYEVPSQITVLTYSSFRDAVRLTEVTFAEGSAVKTIGWQTFSGCESLIKITVPDSVASFDFYAFENCTALTDVVLGEGTQLTGVYEGAFYNCTALNNITLPDTVVEISDYAFYNCAALTKSPLSENSQVKGIYDYAFYGCSGITEIPVLSRLVEIGEYAFAYTGIAEYTVAATVNDIAFNAFTGCENFTAIYCDEVNKDYVEIDGALYEKGADSADDWDALVIWPYGKVLVIGEGKTEITSEDTAFIDKVPKDIAFAVSESVTSIGSGAFLGRNTMTILHLPDSITSIGDKAFYGCTQLTRLEIPESVTTIGDDAFNCCSGLQSIEIPEGATSIGNGTFSGCSALSSIIIPDSVTSIGEEAFFHCRGLSSLTIPASVTSIGKEAFYGCSKLTSAGPIGGGFNMEFGWTQSIPGYAFYDCDSLKCVYLPATIQSVGDYAFYHADNLTIMLEGSSVPKEGVNSYCDASICANVDRWGISDRFFYCITKSGTAVITRCFHRLGSYSVEIPSHVEDIPVTVIGQRAFSGSYMFMLNEIIIPDTVTTIESYAFEGTSAGGKLYIPESVTTIKSNGFEGYCGLVFFMGNELPVSLGSNWLGNDAIYYVGAKDEIKKDGFTILVRQDNTCVVLSYSGDDTVVKIPSSVDGYPVREIREGLLQHRDYLEYHIAAVWIPKSVTTIGEEAFYGSQLTIMLESDQEPASVGMRWADECQVLYGVTRYGMTDYGQFYSIVNDREAAVGRYLGEGTAVIIPDTIEGVPVTKVNANAFYERSDVTSVRIPDTVDYIGESAFFYCKGLTEVDLPESLTSLGRFAFRFCYGLTSASIPDGVTKLLQSTFGECTNLKTVKLPNRLEILGYYVFDGCESLSSIVIPETVTSIDYRSFHDCLSLQTVYINSPTIAAKLTEGNYAVCVCEYAETVSVSGDITEVGDYITLNYAQTEEFTRDGISYVAYSNHTHEWEQTLYVEYIECQQEGREAHTCTVCGLEKSTTTPAHDLHDSVVEAATCFENGLGRISCSRCEYSVDYEITAAGKHSLTLWYTVEEATDNSGGMSRRDCENCDYYETGDFTTVDSGTCGENAEWILTGAGELRITGTGDMPSGTSPWSSYAAEIQSVEIDSGITSISASAFLNCTSLTSVIIPNSVTSIGKSAFNGCSSLNALTIPNGVVSIGDYALKGCTGLTSIILPDSITSIGEYAFQNCTALEEVTLSANLSCIPAYAFYNCTSLAEINISNSVISIERYALGNCDALTTISIPDSVTSIADYAFGECSGLTSILVDANNPVFTSLDGVVFNKNCTTLKLFPSGRTGVYTVPSGVSQIGPYAFYQCVKLTGVVIPGHVQGIGNYAFASCTGLQTVEMASGVTVFGQNVFQKCTSLESLVIPDTITEIPAATFYQCSALTSITIPDSVVSVGRNAFYGCSKLKNIYVSSIESWLNISSGGYEILYVNSGQKTLYSNGELVTDLVIPDTVTYIPEYAFYQFSNLESVTISNTVAGIGQYAFSGCSGLTDITISDSVTSIGGSAFSKCYSLTSITIPDGVTSIGGSAFSNCAKLTGITIPDSVTSMGSHIFYGCSNLASATLPAGLTNIGNYTFYYCGSLTDITIPESVTSIGQNAFYNCSSLTSIIIPDGVTSIAYATFYGCTNLSSVTIPESVTSIGGYAFYSCSSLPSITIPESVTSIGYNAFYVCSGLTEITIPESVTSIGSNAFSICKNLTSITFSGNAPTIGTNAFYNVAATVCYPANNDTWTDSVKQNYGGTITWMAVCAEHEWGEWTVAAESTCIESGEERRDCLKCDLSETREIPVSGHSYESVVSDPTCTEQGYATHTCTKCGDSYVDSYVDALGHTAGEIVVENTAEATCETNGSYDNVTYCTACEEELMRKTVTIPATGHSYKSVVTAPTCEDEGYTTHTCTVCGDSYVDTYVDALGHKAGATVMENKVEATCETDGHYDNVVYCSVCNEELSRETVTVPALGHDYAEVVTKPTCQEQGYTTYTCRRCGEVTVDTIVAALGHSEGETLKENEAAATCTADGSYDNVVYCTVCHEELSRETVSVPATGHNYVDGKCGCGAEILVMDKSISYTVSGQIVTVSCEHPCRVGYWDEEQLQYIAIPAITNDDGSYSFTISESATKLLIVITGDINGDGRVTAPDIARLNAYLKGKTVLTAEVLFAADVNYDGLLDDDDKSAMSKAILSINPILWEVKTEE